MGLNFKILDQAVRELGLLEIEGAKILIDAGLSARKIMNQLSLQKMSIEELDAIFLTHEHNDHSAGIKGLSKFQNLPILPIETQSKLYNLNFKTKLETI